MLKIVPMTKADEHEKACLYCHIPYDKTKFAYVAYQDQKIVAALQFSVNDFKGYITEIGHCMPTDSTEILPILTLIGRAALNFLDLHGVKEAFFEMQGEENEKIAKLIGFKKQENTLYANLDGMFTKTSH